MVICKLCGDERTLVRALIIPAAFYRDLQSQDDRPPTIYGGHYPLSERGLEHPSCRLPEYPTIISQGSDDDSSGDL